MELFLSGTIYKTLEKKINKMNGAGIASAAVFMLLVSMIRLGNKSTFGTNDGEDAWVKTQTAGVKAANKKGVSTYKRPDDRR
jgi:hypothetical protein